MKLLPLGPEQCPGASEGGPSEALVGPNSLKSLGLHNPAQKPTVRAFAPFCTDSATQALPVGDPNGFEAPPRADAPHGAGLLTVEEVARYLGISRATVYKLCSQGSCPTCESPTPSASGPQTWEPCFNRNEARHPRSNRGRIEAGQGQPKEWKKRGKKSS